MSLFQCDKCGVIENTALSDGGHLAAYLLEDSPEEVLASYREILGLKPGQPFGKYCCVCNPMWIADCDCGHAPHKVSCASREYGIGPPPVPKQWHGKFPQQFFPVGTKHTDHNGNIR